MKQVTQSLGQISNNMPEESNDEMLQQMHDKMAEVLRWQSRTQTYNERCKDNFISYELFNMLLHYC